MMVIICYLNLMREAWNLLTKCFAYLSAGFFSLMILTQWQMLFFLEIIEQSDSTRFHTKILEPIRFLKMYYVCSGKFRRKMSLFCLHGIYPKQSFDVQAYVATFGSYCDVGHFSRSM